MVEAGRVLAGVSTVVEDMVVEEVEVSSGDTQSVLRSAGMNKGKGKQEMSSQDWVYIPMELEGERVEPMQCDEEDGESQVFTGYSDGEKFGKSLLVFSLSRL